MPKKAFNSSENKRQILKIKKIKLAKNFDGTPPHTQKMTKITSLSKVGNPQKGWAGMENMAG